MRKNSKKGQMGGVWAIGLGFIIMILVITLLLSMGGDLIGGIQKCGSGDNVSTTRCEDPTYVYNISGNALDSTKSFSSQIPSLSLIMVVVLILAIIGLIGLYSYNKSKGGF